MGSKPCNQYKSGINFLTLKIFGQYFKIPMIFFTKDTNDSKCMFLFELNDEYQAQKDDMVTDEGISDYKTNNG